MKRAQGFRSGSFLLFRFFIVGANDDNTTGERMIAENTSQSRPHFQHPEDWLEHYKQCRESGYIAWHPATRDELLLAESVGLLESHSEWLPCSQGLRLLGLPDWFGRSQSPFSPEWTERFLQTFVDDQDLRSAFRQLLNNEVAS